MTWREAVYMVLDELKLMSDDASFNEDHIIFLLGKYRSFILKQVYSKVKQPISESNYQTICMDLTLMSDCEYGDLICSNDVIPTISDLGTPRVFTNNYYYGDITFVSKERMRYVGNNKWLSNIIYCSIGPDKHLYFKSSNPQFKYLESVKFTAIFEDATKASELSCDKDNTESCDILDTEFPLETALVPQLIELTVTEIKKALYDPEDIENNANDDLANLINFIRRNMKSNLQKQIEQ